MMKEYDPFEFCSKLALEYVTVTNKYFKNETTDEEYNDLLESIYEDLNNDEVKLVMQFISMFAVKHLELAADAMDQASDDLLQKFALDAAKNTI